MVDSVSPKAEALIPNVSTVVVAQDEVIRLAVISLLASGHLLLNDLPGVGKTLLASSIARSIGSTFKRVQFTPDLLPTDITGAAVYNQTKESFQFIPGPVFANVVLADEINRTSSRTQSALLEAMGEGQITVDGQTHILDRPFWVVATQNEVDPCGTFPLPHAQLDRFLISLSIGYPDDAQQVAILERSEYGDPLPSAVLTPQEVSQMQDLVQRVQVARPVIEYVARILTATREQPEIALGVSPRGGVLLQRAAQACAALDGRSFVTPDDVKAVAEAVIAHRLILAPSSGADPSPREVIADVLATTSVPL